MQKKNIPCVIFAGGRSSRMQTDKSLLPFGGEKTLTQYQLKRLSSLFETVYISTRDTQKFDFEANFIKDIDAKDFSPLVALVSVFERIDADAFFALSVDTPFVGEKEIDALCEDALKYDASVAVSGENMHPLCCIYHRRLLPSLYVALKEDNHRLQSVLKKAHIQKLKVDENALLNLNYPSDYEEALARVS